MDKKLLGLFALFFISFLFFLSVVLFNQPLSSLIRAREDTAPSSQNSLMFAWPIEAKADGQSAVQIDVFVRSESNKLVANREVKVSTNLGQVQPASTVSDKNGRASFNLVSSQAGIAKLSATIDNSITLSKELTVKFE